MANKYKVGDRVKLVGWKESTSGKKGRYGEIFTIKDVHNGMEYPYVLTGDTFYGYRDEELEPACEKKIIITTDGATTLARLYDGSKVIKSAEAKCSPEDTFDFAVGAKLAYDRLMEEKPTYKPGDKVKVIGNTCRHSMKIGDIITLKDNAIWGADCWHYYEHLGYIRERDIEPYTPVVVNGFKVGDRVNYKGCNGTIICIAYDETLGVEFDNDEIGFHDCEGERLIDGKVGTKCTSYWLSPTEVNLKHGEIKGYNGKVVCVKSNESFKVGKVYEIVNGVLYDEYGHKRPKHYNPDRRIESLDDGWINGSYVYKFIPYVE